MIDYFKENSIFVKRISCGGEHTTFVSFEGCVYTCGEGNLGQLGNGKRQSECIPVKLELAMQINEVSCGLNYTLLLASTGFIYSFGSNKQGQLGTGNRLALLTPQKVDINIQFVKVVTLQSSCALTDEGKLYIWELEWRGYFITYTNIFRHKFY